MDKRLLFFQPIDFTFKERDVVQLFAWYAYKLWDGWHPVNTDLLIELVCNWLTNNLYSVLRNSPFGREAYAYVADVRKRKYKEIYHNKQELMEHYTEWVEGIDGFHTCRQIEEEAMEKKCSILDLKYFSTCNFVY